MQQQAGAPGRFDFGLSEEEEARAATLHHDSIVFDMVSMYAGGNLFSHYPQELQREFRACTHNRSGARLFVETVFWPFEMALLGKSDLIRQWLQTSGLTCGAYDIDLPAYDGGDPLSYDWDARIRRYAQMPWLRFVSTAADIRRAKRDGAIALYAFYQPVVPVLRDLKAFDVAHEKGLRAFMLTYNRMDHIGVGCTERVDAGLSMFGVDVVRRCNDLGIIVDTSHCGPLTTLDACRHSSKPVTANHTAASAIYAHPRGKGDEALRAIAATGGVIGVVAVPYFLSANPDASIESMLDHIDHVANLVGWRHVAIGSDWPLQAPDDVLVKTLGSVEHTQQAGWGTQLRRDVTQRLTGFEDCRDLPNITRGLVKRGYDDEQIKAILGENALRVFEQVCG
jgi:membrane dipeptidase